MPPKRKDRGWTARLPCKRARRATSIHDLQPVQHQSAAETALSTATLEKLLLLSASSLRSHLKTHALPCSGNKATMANRLYNYFQTSGITPSTNSRNSMVPSDYTTTRNRGQSTTAISNSVKMPPSSRFRENSDNPTITASSTAAIAQSSCNIPPPAPQGNGQPLSWPESGSNFPVQLAHQLTNLFRQFMPVDSRINETASHIGPPLQPMTINNCSAISQFQASGASVVTTTCQMPSSSIQPVLAINTPVTANNSSLPGGNQLPTATDEVLSAASPTQPLTLTTNPHPIRYTSESLLMQPLPMNSYQRGIIMDSLQQSLPPVPARIKGRIIKGEYIDLTTLLPIRPCSLAM